MLALALSALALALSALVLALSALALSVLALALSVLALALWALAVVPTYNFQQARARPPKTAYIAAKGKRHRFGAADVWRGGDRPRARRRRRGVKIAIGIAKGGKRCHAFAQAGRRARPADSERHARNGARDFGNKIDAERRNGNGFAAIDGL